MYGTLRTHLVPTQPKDINFSPKSIVSHAVGYNTGNLTKNNFNMVGINWVGTDGSGVQLDSITGAGLYGSTDPYAADLIKIWDPATSDYEVWYYYVDENDHQYDGWWDQGTQMTMFKDVHPEGLANGSSVWYLSAKDATGGAATLSGAVDTAADVTLTLTKGNFNQISNPYPTGLQLNNSDQVTWENAFGSTDPYSADLIKIWDPTTSDYEVWYYYYDENDHQYDGWWDQDTQMRTFDQDHPNGLATGTPVWYLAAGTFGQKFDVTFKTPLSK